MLFRILSFIAALGAGSLAVKAAEASSAILSLFECLDAKGAAISSAHRGGPAAGYPENAIETMQRGRKMGVRLFEIDVARSIDGVLYLMHDRTLDRTTTGSGSVNGVKWSDIKVLKLEDNAGNLTEFSIPTLAQALAWAIKTDSYLSLDLKSSTSLDEVASIVTESGAGDRLLILPNSNERAKLAQELFPKAIISVAASSQERLSELEALGLDKARLIVWTGFRRFNPDFVGLLQDRGYYPSFGTLGFGNSYDDRIKESGNLALYADIAGKGSIMIATDAPIMARQGLQQGERAWDSNKICQ